jgi:hypothetical protein
MIGRVRGIVLMTKLDVRDHSFKHFHQILVGSLDRFARRHSRRRVYDEHVAQPVADFGFGYAPRYAISYVEHLLIASSRDGQRIG